YAGSVRASMRGPYSEYAAPPIYVYPDRPKPGVHFSRTELGQLAVAILALSGAFTVVYIRSQLDVFISNPGPSLDIVFPASLLATVNAILAGFNMIPVMPLDGAKVWAWTKGAYVALAAVAVGLIVLNLLPGLL